jgi:serine/threonine-protein kinase
MNQAVDIVPTNGQGDRLDSWKEIAVYLGRGVTTVQRWERDEGLPVHRQQHDTLGSVYAFKHELEVWRTKRVARVGLDDPPEPGPAVDVRRWPGPWRALRPLLLGLLAGTALALAGLRLMQPSAALPVRRLTIVTASGAPMVLEGTDRSLAITPDGSRVIYVGGIGASRLYVRALSQLEDTPIAGLGAPRHPFVSPDGNWIGFFDENILKKVPISGGPATTLTYRNSPGVRGTAVAATRAGSRGATWGADNTITFSMEGHLLRVSADGGRVDVLTSPDPAKREAAYSWPENLPDGRGILFTILPAGDWSETGSKGALPSAQIAVLDFRTGQKKVLLTGGSHAHYVASGHLVYAAAGTLKAVPFDLDTLTVLGTPRTVVSQVAMTVRGAADFDVARDGTLVYARGSQDIDSDLVTLTWVNRSGVEEPLPTRPFVYRHPRLSPDGTRLAVGSRRDLGVVDLSTGTLAWFGVGPASYPVWTPDGTRLLFASTRTTQTELYSQLAGGGLPPERIATGAHNQFPNTISPDGTHLVLREDSDSTDLVILDLGKSQAATPLVETPFGEQNAQISPDGRFIAYQSNASGQDEVYVQPFPVAAGKRWTVSSGGGTQPVWARDLSELFYVSPIGEMMSVALDHQRGGFAAGKPRTLFEGPYYVGVGAIAGRTYDVSPIDGRFLMLKHAGDPHPVASSTSLEIVLNWFEELKQLTR